MNPRGYIPLLQMNGSTVVGDNVKTFVKHVQNGSDTSLMFDPIPAWITEVPLKSLATDQDLSNLEVYVRADSGDVLKAVCDNSGTAAYKELGMVKGIETSCAYKYEANVSAIVSNFTMSELDADFTLIEIYGSNFQLAGPNPAYVTVTVATHNCNITVLTSHQISCVVGSVTWGYHAPSVSIKGYGSAVIATDKLLYFAQSVYSISPSVGSFAGGQIVTIEGRGLRPNATIRFDGIAEPCEIVTWSSTVITCRTPASPTFSTHIPSSYPSSPPSRSPQTQPSNQPYAFPSASPSQLPVSIPSAQPSEQVILFPTSRPSFQPITDPTKQPVSAPSFVSKSPVTDIPTLIPSVDSTVSSVNPSQLPSFATSMLPSQSTNVPTVLLSDIPTATTSFPPSQEPSESSLTPSDYPTSATANPSSQESLEPSQTPSENPSTSTSILPTPESLAPSQAPSESPSTSTSIPPTLESFAPSQAPSEFPSSISPAFLSTKVSTESPSSTLGFFSTFSPVIIPTEPPSTAPTTEYPSTIGPSQISTQLPISLSIDSSQQPSQGPSESSLTPSDYPTYATDYPSSQDSLEPSLAPSEFPSTSTSIPPIPESLAPSQAPSGELPTSISPSEGTTIELISTELPTLEPTESTRRLLRAIDNAYFLTVDGFNTTLAYGYDARFTPIIQSISPPYLSSGFSVNITVRLRNVGADFMQRNISIMIEDQVCSQVNRTSSGFVSCVLNRNASAVALTTCSIKLYVEGDGYASSHILNELPTVERGFELFTSQPLNGSTLGGNIISIQGFGFDSRNPQRHIVQLSEVGLPAYTEYDKLLLSLGFHIYSNRSADEVLNCTVLSLNFTQLQCQLAPHLNVYPNKTYIISVTLNNIMAFSSSNLTYIQSMQYTPTLASDVQILSWTSRGEYTFTVTGTLLNAGELSVAVGSLACTVTSIVEYATYQKVTVVTPPLTAGNWTVFANVTGKGVALTEANITVGNHIESAVFATSEGSIGGGTVVTISGYGFSPDCDENVVMATASSSVQLKVSEYVSCLPYELIVRTPAALSHFSASVHASSAPLQVSSLSTHLWRAESVVAKLDFAISPFAFSLASTPRTRVNRSSGFGGLRTEVLVDSRSGDGSHNLTIKVGGKNCLNPIEKYLPHSYFDISVDFSLPDLQASSSPYNILVDLYPVGYAVMNVSSAFYLPTYVSLLEAASIGTVSSSVFGGVSIGIEGNGFSDALTVNVCDIWCPISGTISNSNFTCVTPTRLTKLAVDGLNSLGLIGNWIGSVTGTGTLFSSPVVAGGNYNFLTDGDYEDYFSVNSKTCSIGLHIPVGFHVTPYRMRFYPRLRHADDFSVVFFEGSVDGITYSSLGSLSSVHEGWNFITAPSNGSTEWFSYLRFRVHDTSKSSYCALAELDFLGVVAAINDSCPIVVTSNLTQTKIPIGHVKFESLAAFTPIISAITPDNGTALGGSLVTLIGENLLPLPDSIGEIVITFSGVKCSVVKYESTSIQCITGRRRPENIESE